MKYMDSAFSIGILMLFLSCRQSNRTKTVTPNKNDSTKTNIVETEQDQLETNRRIIEAERIDSIRLDSILQEAIEIAAANQENRFSKQYVATMPDSSFQVDVTLSSEFYFTKEFPHLIIRRRTPSSVYINIFSKTDKGLQQVLSHEQWNMEYTGDTIHDINGDHLKDFVVNWYGVNGCCLKGFSDIYLLRSDKLSFSNGLEFINPTFSPKEQMIRGICYGHPGETEIYKYKWNGEDIDTVEYIYHERNDKNEKTGKVIVSNNEPGSDNHKVLQRLNAVPAEYKKIDNYDWFKGN